MVCGHCKSRGVTVAHVRECSGNKDAGVLARQAFAEIGYEGGSPNYFPQGVTPAEVAKAREVVTTAPRLVDPAKVVPWDVEPAPKPKSLAEEPEEGVYIRGGDIYKVVQGQTGRWYVKRWNGDGVWAYEGREPLYRLTAGHKITAEEAAKFGYQTGACVFCQRKLTDERSIAVGYGPTCAARQNLPWGA